MAEEVTPVFAATTAAVTPTFAVGGLITNAKPFARVGAYFVLQDPQAAEDKRNFLSGFLLGVATATATGFAYVVYLTEKAEGGGRKVRPKPYRRRSENSIKRYSRHYSPRRLQYLPPLPLLCSRRIPQYKGRRAKPCYIWPKHPYAYPLPCNY